MCAFINKQYDLTLVKGVDSPLFTQ